MGRSCARLTVVSAERGRSRGGASDEIDWDAAFDRNGTGWYCGYVYPLAERPDVMTMQQVEDMPRCGRWHTTRELREACDHGLTPVDQDAPDTGPVSPVPIETTGRPNRWDGSCLWCGTTVLAGCGQLVDIDGLLRPVHLDGDCA